MKNNNIHAQSNLITTSAREGNVKVGQISCNSNNNNIASRHQTSAPESPSSSLSAAATGEGLTPSHE